VHRLLVLLSALLVASSSRRIESACCAAIGPRQVDSVQSSSLSTHLSFLCKATILGCGLSDLYRKIPPKKGQISFSSNFVLSALQPRARFIISFDPTNTNGNGHPEYAHTGNRNPSPILTYCLSSRSCAHTQFLRNQLQSGRLSWWRGGTNREENIRRMAPEMEHMATTLRGSRCARPSPRHSILRSNPLFLLPTPALIFSAAVDSLGFGCTAPLSLLVPPPNQIQTRSTVLTLGMVSTHLCCSVQLVYSSVLVDCLPIQVEPAINRAEIHII